MKKNKEEKKKSKAVKATKQEKNPIENFSVESPASDDTAVNGSLASGAEAKLPSNGRDGAKRIHPVFPKIIPVKAIKQSKKQNFEIFSGQ